LSDFRAEIGKRITACRERAGYRTRAQLAKDKKLDASKLSRLERGLSWGDYGSFVNLAAALNCDVREFFQDPPQVTQSQMEAIVRKLLQISDPAGLARVERAINQALKEPAQDDVLEQLIQSEQKKLPHDKTGK
jgi:transcriptional regulator with XRE-family HTH domain